MHKTSTKTLTLIKPDTVTWDSCRPFFDCPSNHARFAVSVTQFLFILIMSRFLSTFLYLSSAALSTDRDDESSLQRPLAVIWPPQRENRGAQASTPPCGVPMGSSNRTEYPLSELLFRAILYISLQQPAGGHIKLQVQQEIEHVQVAIAHMIGMRSSSSNKHACSTYSQERLDPLTNEDFALVFNASQTPALDRGQSCFSLPDPPISVQAGTNATLQVTYSAAPSIEERETLYSCADIVYVPSSMVNDQGACFNTSDIGSTTTTTTRIPQMPPSSSSGPLTSPSYDPISQSTSPDMPAGIVLGFVIGSIIGTGTVTMVIAALVYSWRARRQPDYVDEGHLTARAVGQDTYDQGRSAPVGFVLQHLNATKA